MGKALKTAGVIIGAAALIATGVGAIAMPGLAGSTTLLGVSTGTLNTISSGLVAVGGMLDKPKSQGSAQPDEWTSNPDQPIPFLFGRMGVAGKIVQRDEFGPDNMYQGIVGIISGAGPIKGIQTFRGDDQTVTFDGTGKAVTSQWQGEMWMVRRAGNQPDTVLSVPAGLKSGGSSFQWSPSARLSGKACYLQILGENSKGTAYPGGIPDPVHVGEGIYGYDPRYDSTYPGGDGPCRLGVRSTYRYIEDPIIGGLNWALGLVENGQVVGGIGASPDGIDLPAFVECANISEANGWKLAAWPDTSEDASSVLDQFLQAGGAVRARHAGKISCVSRGAPRASVVTITARDMAGAIELNAAPSLFDQLNTITPRFMSEAAGWKLTPANPVSFAEYVTEDGGKHSDQIDYRFVPLLKQAAELAAYDILDAREPFSGSVPLKPHMRLLKRGDCFVIDNPGVLLDGVKCIVLSRSYDPKTAEVRIGFRSETDGKHDLALGKTTTLPEFPVLTPPDPTYVSPPLPDDWVIVPRPPGTGGQVPGFDLSGQVGNDTATAIQVDWWEVPTGVDPNDLPPADADWQSAGTHPPTATIIPIDVQPDRYYWIGLTYIRNQNYSERVPSGPWLSGKLISDDVNPNAPGLDQIKDDIQEAFGDLLDFDNELAQARLDLDAAEAEIVAARGAQPNLNARIAQVNQARIDGDTAIATSVSGLTARTAQTEADIIDLELAQANETSARVAAVNQLTARQAREGSGPIYVDATASRFTNAVLGAPEAMASFTAKSSQYIITVDGDRGARSAPAISEDLYTATRAIYPIAPGRVYELRVDYFLSGTSAETDGVRLGVRVTTADGAAPAGSTILQVNPVVGRGRRVAKRRFARGGAPGAVTIGSDYGYVRPFLHGPLTNGTALPTASGYLLTVYSMEWVDVTDEAGLEASVTEQSLAIIDLENQQALASWQLVANASGGKPARIGLTSSSLGSFIALDAPYIFWGDNTVFDDATDTLQTTIGGRRRVLAFGAPFGASGNLLEWWGADNVALGAMTTANGLNGRMTTSPYVFDNVNQPRLTASLSPVNVTASGIGTLTTNQTNVSVQNATGTVRYVWQYLSGDTSITPVNAGTAIQAFTGTVSNGQTKTAAWSCTAYDGSGQAASAVVQITIVGTL